MKLAQIVKIKSFEVIPGKDNIHLASMEGNGWKCVCKKSDFKEGDLAVFFVIDSLVDKDNPEFQFLEKRHFRIWNAKFGGVASQGLLVPTSILTHYLSTEKPTISFQEGDDVTEFTKTTKYERPIDIKMEGQVKGGFPTSLLSITDEDSLAGSLEALKEFEGQRVYLTMKMDGSSGTWIFNSGEFQVCSRRLSLKEGENPWWRMAKKYDVENKLRALGFNIAVQFECCGPKLNGNKIKMKEEDAFVFNIKNLDNGKWYGFEEIEYFCEITGFKMVPLIKECDFSEVDSLEKLQEISNGLKYPEGNEAEGLVIRPVLPKWSYVLAKWLSVKVINQNYKE